MSDTIIPALESIQTLVESKGKEEGLTGPLRVKALERELDQLGHINETIDNVITSMEASASNMDTVLSTTGSSIKLLDLWTKILSQTSYTNAILSDKNWKGISKNEEEYQMQVRKLEELQKRYNQEKQRREKERELSNQKKRAQEKKVREREEALRRRVYGNSSQAASTRGVRTTSSTAKTHGAVGMDRGGSGSIGRAHK